MFGSIQTASIARYWRWWPCSILAREKVKIDLVAVRSAPPHTQDASERSGPALVFGHGFFGCVARCLARLSTRLFPCA